MRTSCIICLSEWHVNTSQVLQKKTLPINYILCNPTKYKKFVTGIKIHPELGQHYHIKILFGSTKVET